MDEAGQEEDEEDVGVSGGYSPSFEAQDRGGEERCHGLECTAHEFVPVQPTTCQLSRFNIHPTMEEFSKD